MSKEMLCPFCQQELGVILCDPDDIICPKCRLCGTESLWQALIQARQQLKLLEPIVAELQGRADINAEEARDSSDLVVQWYEKYEQSQKDLGIARQALEKLICEYNRCRDEEFEGEDIDWEWWTMAAKNVAENALEQITHENKDTK